MDKEIRKQLEKVIEIANEPYHKDKLAMMLAETGRLLLFIPSIKDIVEGKAKQN